MATKKSGGDTRKSKRSIKRSTKERAAKTEIEKIMEQDPPIIIGGGGSVLVYLWWRSAVPHPSTDPDYICYKLNRNIRYVYVDDGLGQTRTIPVDSRRHVSAHAD